MTNTVGLKKYKNIILSLIIIVILLSISVFISMDKFSTLNPVKSGLGLIKIAFTDTDIIQIQDYPKVYLAKSDNAQETLINFMESLGYDYLEDERMGSILVFESGESRNYIQFFVNNYYSKWVFNE